MFLKFAPAIKSENAGNTFYDQFYCSTFTMFKNHLTLNFAFSLKKTYGNTAILGFHTTSPKFKLLIFPRFLTLFKGFRFLFLMA